MAERTNEDSQRYWLMQDHTDLRVVRSEEAPDIKSKHGNRAVVVRGLVPGKAAAEETAAKLAANMGLALQATEGGR